LTLKHPQGVINIASISGITRTSQHHVKYNASKAASIHLSALLAQEFSRPGVRVRVNAISPGISPSGMTADGVNDLNKSQIPASSSMCVVRISAWERLMRLGAGYGEKKGIPAGRPGAEADMAQAALFLGCCQYADNAVRFTADRARVPAWSCRPPAERGRRRRLPARSPVNGLLAGGHSENHCTTDRHAAG
jgi:NAD(P)-dependent dehydrogenase (short-subunit alcohol dehydrogenase family)